MKQSSSPSDIYVILIKWGSEHIQGANVHFIFTIQNTFSIKSPLKFVLLPAIYCILMQTVPSTHFLVESNSTLSKREQ